MCERGISPEDILILDKDGELGGVLKYNLDGNYGLAFFNAFVSSYEFLNFLMEKVEKFNIRYYLNAYVSEVSEKSIKVICKDLGRIKIDFEVLIIATGSKQLINLNSYICDENILNLITTGNFFQKNIVLNGILLSKDVLIMGSTSRELSLAKRIILEGGNVKAIVESESSIVSNHLNLIKFIKMHNVNIYLNASIEKISESWLGLQNYLDVLIKVDKSVSKNILCEKIICPFNYFPETNFLNGFLELGHKGEVLINDRFMTSKQGIFSIGNNCNLRANGDSVYVDAVELSKCVLNYINKIEVSQNKNVEINYDKDEIELISPKYITNAKEKKHIIILSNPQNISRNVKILANGKELFDFKILRFEKYMELLVDFDSFDDELENFNISFV